MKEKNRAHQASFRDPSGFVYSDGNTIRREIKPIYFPQYYKLRDSGFFNSLFSHNLLIPHQETLVSAEKIIITPEPISFITYPYEWSFDQYKHAALLTLKIQKYALLKGFSLKDASAYNIAFHKGAPIFIDTLSFDLYEEGTPWRAYKQFISHFFGPLVLARYFGSAIFKMMQTHIDGIPVDLIASLLPAKSKLNSVLYTNIHLLARLEGKHKADYQATQTTPALSRKAQINILDSLYHYIQKLQLKESSEWGDYYSKINYDEQGFTEKKHLIRDWVQELQAKSLIDIGGNDGTFARTVIDIVPELLVSDIDSNAVDQNYRQSELNKEQNMLAFVCDVLQPSPGIGFNNEERDSLLKRLKDYSPDVTMALALIHHITLSGNVPFEKSAAFFSSFSKTLIIEFPMREDSWVQSLLLRKREFINHFDFYNIEEFEKSYSKFFSIVKKKQISGSHRILFLMNIR